jgi:predicted ATP-dependent endonuclease of OLD family
MIKYPIIRSIELDKSVHKHSEDYTVATSVSRGVLDKLSKVNIFVGGNNSGKSRFMRSLASMGDLRFSPNCDIDKINKLKKDVTESIQRAIASNSSMYHNPNITSIPGITDVALQTDDEYFCREGNDILNDVSHIINRVATDQSIVYLINGIMQRSDNLASDFLRKEFAKEIEFLKELRGELPEKGFSFQKLYIPSLRGLRSLNSAHDYYHGRTMQDYFEGKQAPAIFTGLTLYQRVKDLLLGDLHEREAVKDFEAFLGDAFFEKRPVALIPRKDKDVLFVKVGNEAEFPIYELGDGIQAIIIMTFPLFENKEIPLLVFIEEPEVHLHPGLQRIFINTLMTHFEKHQFFMTTHSNHFLDMTLDYSNISIFTLEKKLDDKKGRNATGKFEIVNVSNADTKPLELLGVKNSCVFLSNCTIWVEGITDRRYLSHYLNLYMDTLEGENDLLKRFKEDLHFSFVEYSGGNITHWSFLDEKTGIVVERLCGKLFLIADKDDEEDKAKTDRRAKLEKVLKERYHCLECREIENLLSPEVLKKVVEEFAGKSIKFDYKYEDYKNEYLGSFIEEKGYKKRKGGKFAEKSGTITQKVAFCEKAISHIKSFDDLTEDAQGLTRKLYTFIQVNNHM